MASFNVLLIARLAISIGCAWAQNYTGIFVMDWRLEGFAYRFCLMQPRTSHQMPPTTGLSGSTFLLDIMLIPRIISEKGQTGTNKCGTAANQTSTCQNAYGESLSALDRSGLTHPVI
jgi:hypothetical protein